MEEAVLELTKATDLTTSELLACVEQGATAKNPKEVWNLLYEDTDATYESLADEAQLLHIQYPVLQAVGFFSYWLDVFMVSIPGIIFLLC